MSKKLTIEDLRQELHDVSKNIQTLPIRSSVDTDIDQYIDEVSRSYFNVISSIIDYLDQ